MSGVPMLKGEKKHRLSNFYKTEFAIFENEKHWSLIFDNYLKAGDQSILCASNQKPSYLFIVWSMFYVLPLSTSN